MVEQDTVNILIDVRFILKAELIFNGLVHLYIRITFILKD
jgi:hypothetical protein